MSFISEHVIPGNHGKKFTTDGISPEDLSNIAEALLSLEGIKDVIFEEGKKPIEFVVHTDMVVKVKAIEDRIKLLNLHAVPTGPFFPLF